MREPLATEHFEVLAQTPDDESLVFTAESESEAVGFAINYAHTHPTQAVAVMAERYDPDDRLFKSRRVWSRAASITRAPGRRLMMSRA